MKAMYIDRGAEMVLRHPYIQRGAQLRAFVLEANRDRLQRVCDRYLNAFLRPIRTAVSTCRRPLTSLTNVIDIRH